MKKVLVIVTKNGIKYQIGTEKSVDDVLKEIETCNSPFYKVVETCAIKASEIVSVEQFKYDPEGQGEE